MNAIITGASRGLGLTIAMKLASKGYDLFLVASNAERLQEVSAAIIIKYKVKVATFAIDLNDVETSRLAFQNLLEDCVNVDVLVNNVGAFEMGGLDEVSMSQVDRLLNINFKATFQLTQTFLPSFKYNRAGCIINIGSIATEVVRNDIAAYSISKYALQGYTKMLCEELKDFGVKVAEIIPGSINTTSWDGIEAPKADFVQPDDIADCIEMIINSSKGANFEQVIIRPTNRNF